ncbi:MAG: hypothetical protein QW776_05095 [Candidatus Nitrosocaldus sp.]
MERGNLKIENGKEGKRRSRWRNQSRFSKHERQLLSLFVERIEEELSYVDVLQQSRKARIDMIEFYRTLLSLMERGYIFVEVYNTNCSSNNCFLRIDRALLTKLVLDLRLYYAAKILTSVVAFNRSFIASERPVEFNLMDFIYSAGDMHGIYRYKRHTFYSSLKELAKQGYFLRTTKNYYIFNYKKLPRELINILLL